MVDIVEKGAEGEKALNEWLKTQQLSYVAVCQAKETFSPLFAGDVKRPDFLLLFDSIGMIAVDAKNYKFPGGVYTLQLEAELKRSLTFERLFRIPLWYAYYDVSDGQESWYWISALKAAEVGEIRTNQNDKTQFLAIRREEFLHIKTADDLAKLYTMRMGSVSRISSLIEG